MMLSLVRVFYCLFVVIAGGNTHAQSNSCEEQCIAIVDVGSTGSRLHVYSISHSGSESREQIKEVWAKKIAPGFATLEADANTIDKYLTTLLAQAPHSKMPLYFYATAGMRLLPIQQQQSLYHLVQEWFTKQDQWQLSDSKTITGKEEGVYAWMSINYQHGTLNTSQETMGIMDMGGASVQIVFPVQSMENIAPEDVAEVNFQGKSFKLYAHSFLGLGQTEVAHHYLDDSSCFAQQYLLPSGEKAQGNAASCEQAIVSLVNDVHQVHQQVQSILQANLPANWFAIGGIAELAKSKPFQFAGQFTNEALINQANSEVCQQNWPVLMKEYPNDGYLHNYCFAPSYFYALMVEGYGLSPQQPIHFSNTSDWTLGAALMHAL